MPPKNKRIHLVEPKSRMVRLSAEGQLWESGHWALPEEQAKQLTGGSILFHKKKAAPSFFGGTIAGYRIEPKGSQKGRVIFTFKFMADHRNVVSDNRGWSKDVKVSL